MEYDKIGRLTKRTLPDVDSDSPSPTLYEAFEYDESGNTTKHVALTEDVDNPPQDRITTFKYDTNNRLKQKLLPYSHFSASMNDGGSVGAFCSFLVTASEDGASSQAVLDCMHDLAGTYTLSIKEDTGSGLSTIIEYVNRTESPFTGIWVSPLDHLQALHSGNLYLVFEQGGTEVMRGRIIGASPIVEYDYTNNGRRIQAGADTYIYDERGRLTQETKANGQIIEYGYDIAGNRISVTIYAEDGIEITTEAHYSYDALNRIDHVWDGPKDDNRQTDYSYDEVGNLATVHYPNNTSTAYTYDDLNRLISVKQTTVSDPIDSVIEYVYTLGPTGNRQQVDEYQYHSGAADPYANGPYRKVKYKYDKLYRLKGETVLDYTGNIERSVTYEYDKFGNRLSMKVANADGISQVEYTYNERDQLTTETRVFDQVSEVTFKLDGSYYVHAPPKPSVWSGRLLLSFTSLTLTCLLAPFVLLKTNRAGKRARRSRRFTAAISAFMTPMFIITPDALAYLHNDAMWYSAVASGAVGLPGPTTTTVTYSYDNSGNLFTKEEDNGLTTSTIDYVYDAENHLIQVDQNNGPQTIISYTYDADGIRLSKTKAGETTYYTTDKNRQYAQVLEERDKDGNLLIQYAYGHDLISQNKTPGSPAEQIRYFHYDGQMSTRLITEGTENTAFTGWITDKITYDAFGQITDRQDYGNPTNTKYLYTGEQYDNDLNQYYLRARYYDQSVGRFTTKDSYNGNLYGPLSLHKYTYAHSNPVNGADPSGRFFVYITQLMVTNVQAVLRNHKVAVTMVAADRVGAFLDAVVLVLEIVAGGTVPIGLAAGLIASIVPFGWLFRRAKIVGNILEGASDKLTQIYRQMKTGANALEHNKAVEIVGELGAIATAERMGFKPTGFPSRYHGIDGVMQQGDRFVIIEAKGGAGKLGQTKAGEQLSQNWIDDKIEKLAAGLPTEVEWASKLKKAKSAGDLDVLVVKTPVNGDIVGDPVFIKKNYWDVGEKVFE